MIVPIVPYAIEDRARAASMTFVREADNGDRYFSYPLLRGPAESTQVGPSNKQQYFYRAMYRAEADGWMTVGSTNYNDRTQKYQAISAIHIDGHQGWASYLGYSLGYLIPKYGYTDLLEIYAPDFITWLSEVGVICGKAESGDMSWGVGLASSNGFQGNKKSDKALKSLYAKVANNGVEIAHTQVKGGPHAMARIVTPYVFQQSIKWAKLVYLRSVRM